MPIDPGTATLGAAAIGGGANLLGNLIGMRNTDKTNTKNYQIAQMNNQYNSLMLDRQIRYNTDMWNKQNEYNTPAAQMQRYEVAGINPYMALGNIQSGQAQSAGGVTPPTASSATMQSFTPDFSGIGQAAQNYALNHLAETKLHSDLKYQKEMTRQLEIENQYREQKLIEEIEGFIQDNKGKKLANYAQQIENRYLADTRAAQLGNIRQEGEMLEHTVRGKIIENLMNDYHFTMLPGQYKLSFASMAADTLLKHSQKELTDVQAEHEIEKKLKTIAEMCGIKWNNYILQKTAKDIIEKTHKENAGYYWQIGASALGSVIDGVVGFGLGRAAKVLDFVPRTYVKGFR